MPTRYKYTTVNGKQVLTHVLVVGPVPVGFVRGHIDGDSFNNDPSNLRIITQSGNMLNQKRECVRRRESGKWQARIRLDGKMHVLGNYPTEDEARSACRTRKVIEIGKRIYIPEEGALP